MSYGFNHTWHTIHVLVMLTSLYHAMAGGKTACNPYPKGRLDSAVQPRKTDKGKDSGNMLNVSQQVLQKSGMACSKAVRPYLHVLYVHKGVHLSGHKIFTKRLCRCLCRMTVWEYAAY